MKRRNFLKTMTAGMAGAFASRPLMRALADSSKASSEFFIFVHAQGGWDVTLWADPRNKIGDANVDPATNGIVETSGLSGPYGWVNASSGSVSSFQLVKAGQNYFGPAMGSLLDLHDRLCIINGLSMGTVSHPDGTYFSSTGRHLAGGHPAAASIDTMMSNEFGLSQLLPTVSVNYPSTFIGRELDERVLPIRVSDVSGMAPSVSRTKLYLGDERRAAVTNLLAQEAAELAASAHDPRAFGAFNLQYQALNKMLGDRSTSLFDINALQKAYPAFNYTDKTQTLASINSAFAIEAIRKRAVRSMAFSIGNFDSHYSAYRQHPALLLGLFNVLATLVKQMDVTPFEDSHDKLSAHVHILVTSDFCRGPKLDSGNGRGHWFNNSNLIISPAFKGGVVFGETDDKLQSKPVGGFEGGPRQPAPPDVLASLLTAVGVEPRKYLRDGEAIKGILAS